MIKQFAVGVALFAVLLHAGAAEFALTDTNQHLHTLDAHRGQWVLVNLWATWCAPCLTEMPELEALSKNHKELLVLGVAIDGKSEAALKDFTGRLHITYPIVAGAMETAHQFNAKGFPTSILYDPKGVQIMVMEGVLHRADIERYLHVGVP